MSKTSHNKIDKNREINNNNSFYGGIISDDIIPPPHIVQNHADMLNALSPKYTQINKVIVDNFEENDDFIHVEFSVHDISRLIQKLRKKKGLTQSQLASAVGLTQSAVAAFENGKREPSINTICKYADALGFEFKIFCGPR